MFKRNKIKTITTELLESCETRVQDLTQLLNKGLFNELIHIYVKLEAERLMTELSNLLELKKLNLKLNKIMSLKTEIKDLEYQLDSYAGLFTLNQQLYYRLVEDLRNSRKVEVFAGFEPMHPDDELPGFSYGVKLYLNDGTEKNHIFDSSGDGCLMSYVANDSRKRTLNSVISMIDMTIHRIFPKILEDKKLECVIRCDMEIIGFTCPDIFKIIKNGSEVTREDYSGRDVIPQNYLGIKIAGNMFYSTKVEVFTEIEEIEHLSFFWFKILYL